MKRLLILVLVLLLSGCAKAYEPIDINKDVRIMLTSDLHFIDASLIGSDAFLETQKKSDGKLSIYINELADALKEETLRQRPDFLIISGDLTYNGEKISHEKLSEILKDIKRNGTYPLVIPGNHDILNAMAIDYSKEELYYTPYITAEDFKTIYHEFGYEDAASKDDSSLSYLFKVNDKLWFFMLDTNTYDKNNMFAASSEGYLKEETMAWMKEVLKEKDPSTKVIAFTHHPILNMTSMSDYVITNQSTVKDFFLDNGIRLVFSGHIHAQNYKEEDGLINFASSSLSVYDHHYNDITITPDGDLELKAVKLDMEKYADEHDLKDDFFSDFDNNAFTYFKEGSTARFSPYYDPEEIDETDLLKLYDLMGTLNCYEFSGQGHKIKDLISDDDLKLIEKYKNSYAEGLFKIIKYFDKDATRFNITLN